ncbi:hypothetical protein NA57DRAFT_70595 [Rhizodiscina lignyota]|uniref:Heterokaryon incompatibility domain-containing protein n=1 Tax=Rhizodiscina lignyota TaxID=1504668 RepID=A0A9P4IQU0_9PEZI|nr:hypothetical protein NA57DRAFT_70595 [Rhizodiscina lignyota]
MASGYEYKPLNPDRREFRALQLPPQDALDSEPLKCTVQHLSLDDEECPEYMAMSYAWGDPTATHTIRLHDDIVSVPANAELAIRGLVNIQTHLSSNHTERQSGKIESSKPSWTSRELRKGFIVWIDAISINQLSVDERNSQVFLMQHIYARASHVVIWLGEDSDGTTGAAIRSMNHIFDYVFDQIKDKDDTQSYEKMSSYLWRYSEDGHRKIRYSDLEFLDDSAIDWPAIRSFFSSPWFLRLWVIQEVVLARHNVLCIRGKWHIMWFAVGFTARLMESGKWFYKAGGPLQGVSNAADIFDLQFSHKSVPGVLTNSVTFKATEPKDKVYGLLGLLQNVKDFQNISHHLIPDYSKSLAEVYIGATRAALELAQNLGILDLVDVLHPEKRNDDQGTDRIPSWVPRFDWTFDAQLSSPSTIQADYVSGADNGEPLQYSNDNNSFSVLRVRGLIVDEVSEYTKPIQPSLWGDLYSLAERIADSLMLAKQSSPGLTDTERIKAWSIVLAAGLNNERSNAMNDNGFQADSWAFIEHMRTHMVEGHVPENTTGDWKRFSSTIIGNSWNRIFFITKGGRMALGPPGLVKGDKIVILFGSGIPHLLRQQQGCWTFIGSAYVQGIMQGEHVRKLSDEGQLRNKTSTFDIQ